MERFADLLDQAQHLIERETAQRIDLIRLNLLGTGRPDCLECGEPIPPARRQSMPNSERCAPCQQQTERRIRAS